MQTIALDLVGDMGALSRGVDTLREELGITLGPGGLRVTVTRDPGAGVTVTRDERSAQIRYDRPIHFYRALGHLVEGLRHGSGLPVRETPRFETNGVMIDVSQGNAVLRKETVERVLRRMALMGLNMLMLYTEDSYDVPGVPEFGYMRGRYTHEEMRSLDDFAVSLGIELIPCMQTLAHLVDVLKWPTFHPYRDDEDTLLVGDERSYVFIEKMIAAAMAPVRTRRIHIGMDEAWKLGLGKYLAQNGYTPKFDIMNAHLARVLEITRRMGLEPMIWSDMYFRAASRTGDYYDSQAHIPEEVIRRYPQGARLVYWDYYHTDQAWFEDYIERHRRFGSDPIFAGGIWNWFSFGVNQSYTAASTNAALAACKAKGIREVFATIWGDDGNECVIDSTLWGMQLYAEHGYADRVDTERLGRRFETCTGCREADFLATQGVDEVPGVPAGNPAMANPSRYLLWQDPLLGLFDANTRGRGIGAHYGALARRLSAATSHNGASGPALEVLALLASALELKAELGVRLYDTYAARDRAGLEVIATQVIPEVERRVRALRARHREVWLATYKPAGWEVIDLRYGAVLARLETAAARVGDWLAGRVPRIEELEETRLPFNGKADLPRVDAYTHMVSASRLAIAL